jgi:hypothetical protein
MAGYSGTPLSKKLMIKEGRRVALISAPDEFETLLDPLPDSVRISRTGKGEADVIVLFVKSHAELLKRWKSAAARLADGGAFWVSWPKKASGIVTDLNEDRIRDVGLADGLVDYKVCAVDETWSGLCFARRKK